MPVNSDVVSDSKSVKINVKDVERGGSIIGGGSTLRSFKTYCGTKLLFLVHGYYFPEADICLESPQFLSRAIRRPGHAVVNG